MARPKKSHLAAAAARAREGLASSRSAARQISASQQELTTEVTEPPMEADAQPGQVPMEVMLSEDVQEALNFEIGAELDTSESPHDSEDEAIEELEGEELLEGLETTMKSVYLELMGVKSQETWIQGEKALTGVYTGRAARTDRDHRQKSRQRDQEKAVIRES